MLGNARANHPVALARGPDQAVPIQDGDAPATALDEAIALFLARHDKRRGRDLRAQFPAAVRRAGLDALREQATRSPRGPDQG